MYHHCRFYQTSQLPYISPVLNPQGPPSSSCPSSRRSLPRSRPPAIAMDLLRSPRRATGLPGIAWEIVVESWKSERCFRECKKWWNTISDGWKVKLIEYWIKLLEYWITMNYVWWFQTFFGNGGRPRIAIYIYIYIRNPEGYRVDKWFILYFTVYKYIPGRPVGGSFQL